MNKKGFTLIELLAVIVILAIIALIATPIVLNIISDTKEESELRSANFYLDAVELSIAQSVLDGENLADGTYTIKNGNICKNADCIETISVEVKGEVPNIGSIYIKEGQIEDVSLVLNNKMIIKKDGELVYSNKLTDICELKQDTAPEGISTGDKYECRVKAGTKYTFYILITPNSNDTYVNLIMDRNLCSDGTATDAIKEDKCLVQYNITEDAWGVGPLAAMEYLNEATSS